MRYQCYLAFSLQKPMFVCSPKQQNGAYTIQRVRRMRIFVINSHCKFKFFSIFKFLLQNLRYLIFQLFREELDVNVDSTSWIFFILVFNTRIYLSLSIFVESNVFSVLSEFNELQVLQEAQSTQKILVAFIWKDFLIF